MSANEDVMWLSPPCRTALRAQIDVDQVDAVVNHVYDKVWRDGVPSLQLRKYWGNADRQTPLHPQEQPR